MRYLLCVLLIGLFGADRLNAAEPPAETELAWQEWLLTSLEDFGIANKGPCDRARTKYRIESSGYTNRYYLLFSGNRFAGLTEKVAEDEFFFVPYTGNEEFTPYSHALQHAVVTEDGTLRLTLKLLSSIPSGPTKTIEFSTRERMFAGVPRISAGEQEFFPVHTNDRTPHFIGLWKRNADSEWGYYNHLNHAVLEDWSVADNENIRLTFKKSGAILSTSTRELLWNTRTETFQAVAAFTELTAAQK